MKRLLALFAVLLCLPSFAASPTFNSFNQLDYYTNGFTITSKTNQPFRLPSYVLVQGASIAAGVWTNNNGVFGLVPGSSTNTFGWFLKEVEFPNNPNLLSVGVVDASGGETVDQNIFYQTNTMIPFYSAYPGNGTNIYNLLFNDNDINQTAGYIGANTMIARLTNWVANDLNAGFYPILCTVENNNMGTNASLFASDRQLVNSFIRTNIWNSGVIIVDVDLLGSMVSTNETADKGIVHYNVQKQRRMAQLIARAISTQQKQQEMLMNQDIAARFLQPFGNGAILWPYMLNISAPTNPPVVRPFLDLSGLHHLSGNMFVDTNENIFSVGAFTLTGSISNTALAGATYVLPDINGKLTPITNFFVMQPTNHVATNTTLVSSRSLVISNVPPGSWRLEAQVCIDGGASGGSEAQITFSGAAVESVGRTLTLFKAGGNTATSIQYWFKIPAGYSATDFAGDTIQFAQFEMNYMVSNSATLSFTVQFAELSNLGSATLSPGSWMKITRVP